jgi:hypothetical protein
MNDYYNPDNSPVDNTRGIAAQVRAVFATIATGFDKIPSVRKLWGGGPNYAVDAGLANAYVATFGQGLVTAYEAGLVVRLKISNTNTGACTINLNELGARNIRRANGATPLPGDLTAGQIVVLTYDGAYFQLAASGTAEDAQAAAAGAATATAQAVIATTQAGNASTSAAQAAGYAAALSATSTSSLLVAIGSKAFTTQAGKAFGIGQFVIAASAANPANYMVGQVTAYSGTALTLNVTKIGGAGTFADWVIGLSGPVGAPGTPGADGMSIKTTARGVLTIPDGLFSGTATIPAVDPAKTQFRFNGLSCSSNDLYGAMARASLTNGTTVTATRDAALIGHTVSVSWELTEFQ